MKKRERTERDGEKEKQGNREIDRERERERERGIVSGGASVSGDLKQPKLF